MYRHPFSISCPLGCVVDLNRPLCPECAPKNGLATSVHWCSIVLSDAERFVSIGCRPLSLDAYAFCPLTRTMLVLCYDLFVAHLAR